MRVCIYKTDDAPDLTLFLREGLTLPHEARDQNWLPLKTVTKGELSADLAVKMAQGGYCVERLGRTTVHSSPAVRPVVSRRISLRWLGFPKSLRIKTES